MSLERTCLQLAVVLSPGQFCHLCMGQHWHQKLVAFMIRFWVPYCFSLSWEILLCVFNKNLEATKDTWCALPSGWVQQRTALIWMNPGVLLLSSQLPHRWCCSGQAEKRGRHASPWLRSQHSTLGTIFFPVEFGKRHSWPPLKFECANEEMHGVALYCWPSL